MPSPQDSINLSVVLITRNESRHVLACLQSVAFADEWLVVDAASEDDTREIAEAFGARVVRTDDWPGFGAQKSRALALARGRWVLSIDADERDLRHLFDTDYDVHLFLRFLFIFES